MLNIVTTRRLRQGPAQTTDTVPRCRAATPKDRRRGLERDLKTLARFVGVYCRHQHPGVLKRPVEMKHHDVSALLGRPLRLCPRCTKLITHAFTKRVCCPMDPKPLCKHCPNHCYHPTYRKKIREVMRFSGMKIVLSGRLDYLLHFLF